MVIMKRTGIDLQAIACMDNLADAAVKAARGKRFRTDVQDFFQSFETNLHNLRTDILNGKVPYGHYTSFTIHDPKERTIHAACFKDRVIHHALMNHAGPVLERAMVPTAFACRLGKGPLAAVHWVQRGIRRFPWYVKVDIRRYFDSIDHEILCQIVTRRIKGNEVLSLIRRIIGSYHTIPGKGLPIGSLTSQYFANYYLDGLDRSIMERLGACAHARYMDDVIWCCHDRAAGKATLAHVKEYLSEERLLDLKDNIQINRSCKGVTYCGFRIFPGFLKLSSRRCKRYTARRKFWEHAYLRGKINEKKLQSAYASVYGIIAHADSLEWRKEQLLRYPSIIMEQEG